jgi:hypothetical protein
MMSDLHLHPFIMVPTGTGITGFVGSSYKRVTFLGDKGVGAPSAVGLQDKRGMVAAAVFSSTVLEGGSADPSSSPVSSIVGHEEPQGLRTMHRRTRSHGIIMN